MISRNDFLLIAILGCIALILFGLRFLKQEQGGYLTIRCDQEVYGVYPLEIDQEITLEEAGAQNLVRIEDGEVRMIEADCPDQICVNHRAISKDGETIVCLPHKIVLEVTAENVQNEIDIMTK